MRVTTATMAALLAAWMCGHSLAATRPAGDEPMTETVVQLSAEAGATAAAQSASYANGGAEDNTAPSRDGACGAGDGCGCSGGCGLTGLGLFGCPEKEPFELFKKNGWGLKIGGWEQIGYHSRSDGTFNSYPGRVQLQQSWLYAEKKAEAQPGCWDWGFRVDGMYGTDGPDTQAFGSDPGKWDTSWDHGGAYGWALPQLYGELAYDKLSVKFGHFYTLVGYEVVPAPNNFFYSHAFTQYLDEPFTHTGMLGTYKANDRLEVYAGWTLGWDTGFTQFHGQGNNFLGGVAYQMFEKLKVTYLTTVGDLGFRGDGYGHSLIGDLKITDKLNYIVEYDMTDTNVFGYNMAIVQYLIYRLNNCWGVGTRVEWFKFDDVAGGTGQHDVYEWTTGFNWKPHPNFVLRPEVRYERGAGLTVLGLQDEQTSFGIDGVLTF